MEGRREGGGTRSVEGTECKECKAEHRLTLQDWVLGEVMGNNGWCSAA